MSENILPLPLNPFWLIIVAFIVALLPVAGGLITSYVKVSVVMGMLRSGLGVQQLPGNMVVMALSLAVSFHVMSPVLRQTREAAAGLDLSVLQSAPSLKDLEMFRPLIGPWRQFLLRHSGLREIRILLPDGEGAEGASEEQAPFHVLAMAFVLTELREAFAMGFVLLLPFLLIDLIVANLLAGLGMFMVSPLLISLPLKLILFLSCDGWLLLTRGLIDSYAAY